MTCPACATEQPAAVLRCHACGCVLAPALLEIVAGDSPRGSHALQSGGCVIGRALDCDVVLSDRSVSRRHARITLRRGAFYVEDLGSRHGVKVDGVRIRQATRIEPANVLKVGAVGLRLRVLDPDDSTGSLPVAEAAPAQDATLALDALRLGVVLLRSDGSVAFANRSARTVLAQAGVLKFEAGRLVVADRTHGRALRTILAPCDPDSLTRGGAVSVARSGKSPLTVVVAPLGPPLHGQGGASHAVFLGDPDLGVEGLEETLRRLYGLTAAEARLTLELLEGQTIELAAAALAISLNTARNELRSVFQKTGVRRQVELVRLLLSGAALIQSR